MQQWRDSAKDIAHINFVTRKAAKMVHGSEQKYPIGKDMMAELDFLREVTAPESEVKSETPIAHMIKRDPTAVSWSDACQVGAGGYSTDLKFIWYLQWISEIYNRTLAFLDGSETKFISINMLEFTGVIINWCGATTAIEEYDELTKDPWPVLLTWRGINHACTTSAGGRALGRFFCGILMDSRLGINSKWLSTHENMVADDISRLKSAQMKANPDSQFVSIDYKKLLQEHSQLKDCKTFAPSLELLSVLEQCMLTGSCPNQKEIRRLKQAGLGKLILLPGSRTGVLMTVAVTIIII